MDSHTIVEILRGCLTNPTADSHLVYTVLRLTPNPGNALVLYRPQPPPTTTAKAVFPAELFEMILIDLAEVCPQSLLANATRVNSLFRDTTRDSQSIKTILFKDTNINPSAPVPSSNRIISCNPALRKFDIGVVTEWPPTRETDYPKNKHSINGHVFAFSSSLHRRPWAEIQLSAGDEHHIVQSCDDMRLFDPPQKMELHVRYRVEIKGTEARTYPSEVEEQNQIITKKIEHCGSVPIPMVAMARTKAATVKQLFEVANELKKCHPRNWEEHRKGPVSYLRVRLAELGNAAQEIVVSSVKYQEMESVDEYIGSLTMQQPWVLMQRSSSYAICPVPIAGIDTGEYAAVVD
ncbi:hypothetical protein PRZ48_008865 [Zasmidium cellare]|uniref:F-box domain-containing protein n=1 Tax=Zasmidium cellare TaxID=395010 RepID=A0ABR0EHG0_ZASCE|nr:hypothetical protein PRZ48_008865 [Zasmidium cellare]